MVKKSLINQELYQAGDRGLELKYKGVRKRNWGKWVSEIRLPNSRERIWLGSYDSAEKAARAFDAAQICLRGKLANLNFPDNPPEIAGGRQSMTPSEIQAAAARFANLAASVQKNCPDQQLSVQVDAASKNTATSLIKVDKLDQQITVVESSSDWAESMVSYSPSTSDETVQMDNEVMLCYDELSLNAAFGSGNYASEFGYFTGFDDYTIPEYYTSLQSDNNFDYVEEDTYDASLYLNSYLWNF